MESIVLLMVFVYFIFVDMPNEGGYFFELYLLYWNGSKAPPEKRGVFSLLSAVVFYLNSVCFVEEFFDRMSLSFAPL